MEQKSRKTYVNTFSTILLFLSFSGLFYSLVGNDYSVSLLLPFSPFIYFLGVLLVKTKGKYVLKSFVSTVLFSGFFIRMVICPAIMIACDYDLKIPTSRWLDFLDYAVLLVIFEYIALVGYLFCNKNLRLIAGIESENEPVTANLRITTRAIIGAVIIFVIYCVATHPSYLLSIKNTLEFIGYSEQDNALRNKMYLQMREESSSLYTLYFTAIVFLQALLPATLLNAIFKNRVSIFSSRRKTGSVILSLAVIILSLMILTDDNSKSLIVAASIFITLIYVYPDSVRRFIPIFAIGGSVFAIFLLLVKSGMFMGRYTGITSVGKLINTYFSGIPNVAVGISTEYPDKVATLIGDFTRSIPLVAHFFVKFPQSRELFNISYHGISGYLNEIMPTICYGYKYIGPFAPLFSLFVYGRAYNYEKKFHQNELVFNKTIYSYLAIYLAICPIMYMFTSALNMMWYGLIFSIIARSNDRICAN